MEAAGEDEQTAQTLAVRLLREGKSVQEVLDALATLGVEEIAALSIVRRSIDLAHSDTPVNPRKEGWEEVKLGVLLLALSAGVSAVSFAAAEARGRGTIFVAGGAALLAAFYLVKGLWRVFRQ